MIAAVFRTIFAPPNADPVSSTWDHVRDELTGMFPKFRRADGGWRLENHQGSE